jgi:hypothetical protein
LTEVYYSTPYLCGDIGKGINDFIELLPEDCWVVIRDADTLFMTSDQQAQIQRIVESNPPYDLIGCRTNRLRSPYQAVDGLFEEDSIMVHLDLAKSLEKEYDTVIEDLPAPNVIAGMFMLFRKSLWKEHPFPERTIQFDMVYSNQIREAGKSLGIAQGIYLLHLYRYGANDPFKAIEHLIHCHEFNV